MSRLDGLTIGDAWYFQAGDAVHAFFLTKPEIADPLRVLADETGIHASDPR